MLAGKITQAIAIIIDDIQGHEHVFSKRPDFYAGEFIFPPPKMQD